MLQRAASFDTRPGGSGTIAVTHPQYYEKLPNMSALRAF